MRARAGANANVLCAYVQARIVLVEAAIAAVAASTPPEAPAPAPAPASAQTSLVELFGEPAAIAAPAPASSLDALAAAADAAIAADTGAGVVGSTAVSNLVSAKQRIEQQIALELARNDELAQVKGLCERRDSLRKQNMSLESELLKAMDESA